MTASREVVLLSYESSLHLFVFNDLQMRKQVRMSDCSQSNHFCLNVPFVLFGCTLVVAFTKFSVDSIVSQNVSNFLPWEVKGLLIFRMALAATK